MVETSAGTPFETGGKAPYFSVKLLVNYTFMQYLYWGVVQKPRFLGKGGVGFVHSCIGVGDSRVENPPGFVWSSIGLRIGLVDFHQITTLKHVSNAWTFSILSFFTEFSMTSQ